MFERMVINDDHTSLLSAGVQVQEPHVTHFRIPSYLHSPISPRWTERIESSGFLKVETTNSLTFYSWDNQVSIDSDLVFGNQMCTIQRIYSQNWTDKLCRRRVCRLQQWRSSFPSPPPCSPCSSSSSSLLSPSSGPQGWKNLDWKLGHTTFYNITNEKVGLQSIWNYISAFTQPQL